MNLLELNSRCDEHGGWLDKYISDKYKFLRNHITIIFGNSVKFTGVTDDELSNMSKEELIAKLKEEYIRRFYI